MEHDPIVPWEELLSHRRFLGALARALVEDPSLVGDVAQETWLAAAKNPPAAGLRLIGWIRRVAIHVVGQWQRKDRSRTRRETLAAAGEELADTTEVVAQRLEVAQIVVAAVQALDMKYRSVIVLRFWEDLTPGEIARRLQEPAATVRTRLRRALEELRTNLETRFEDGEERWCEAIAPLILERSAAAGVPVALALTAVGVGVVLVGVWITSEFGSPSAPATILPSQVEQVEVASSPNGDATKLVSESPAEQVSSIRQDEARWATYGQVLDVVGRPLAGARVDIYSMSGRLCGREPLRTVESGADGRFRIQERVVGGWLAFASLDGYTTAEEMYFSAMKFKLVEARTIRGVVTDSSGRPIPRAWVIGLNDDSHSVLPFEPPEAQADASGPFTLSAVPITDVRLAAIASGFQPRRSRLLGKADDEIHLSLEPMRPSLLEVTVLDQDGQPAQEAVVRFDCWELLADGHVLRLPREFDHSQVPRDGVVERDDLPAGEYDVMVFATDHEFDPDRIRIRIEPGETTRVVMQAVAGGRKPDLRGVLRTTAGEPISQSKLVLEGKHSSASVTTNEDGSFVLASPVGLGLELAAWLADDEWYLVRSADAGLDRPLVADPNAVLELTAAREFKVWGRVVDESGTPVEDVSVSIDQVGDEGTEALASTVSRDDGYIEMSLSSEDRRIFRVRAETKGAPTVEFGEFEQGPGAGLDVGHVVVQRPGSITGRVVDETKLLCPGVVVRLLPEDAETLTDRQGQFLFDGVDPGEHELFTRESKRDRTEFGPYAHSLKAEKQAVVELLMRRETAESDSVTGYVRFSDGRMVESDELCVELDWSWEGGASGRLGEQLVNGRFQFKGLSNAPYRLWAHLDPDSDDEPTNESCFLMSEVLEVVPGESLRTLVLPDAASTATVIARFTGAEPDPLPPSLDWDLVIPSKDSEGELGLGGELALTDGRVRLSGFSHGEYRLSFRSSEVVRATCDVSVRGAGVIDLGVIELSPLPRVRGQVVDAFKVPIPGVVVRSGTVPFELGWRREFKLPLDDHAVTSDRDGRFDLVIDSDCLAFWKAGFAPLCLPMDDSSRSEGSNPLEVVLRVSGQLELVNLPKESRTDTWWACVESLESQEIHGAYQTRSSSFRVDSEVELLQLPVGLYAVYYWKQAQVHEPKAPPSTVERYASYRWEVHVLNGETTTIDVAARW